MSERIPYVKQSADWDGETAAVYRDPASGKYIVVEPQGDGTYGLGYSMSAEFDESRMMLKKGLTLEDAKTVLAGLADGSLEIGEKGIFKRTVSEATQAPAAPEAPEKAKAPEKKKAKFEKKDSTEKKPSRKKKKAAKKAAKKAHRGETAEESSAAEVVTEEPAVESASEQCGTDDILRSGKNRGMFTVGMHIHLLHPVCSCRALVQMSGSFCIRIKLLNIAFF